MNGLVLFTLADLFSFRSLFISVFTRSVVVLVLFPDSFFALVLSSSFSLYLHLSPSSSLHDVISWIVARCTLTHSDARTPRILAVYDYQRAPITTSCLSLRQLCVRMSVVLWRGGGGAWRGTVEGYNLVVNERWGEKNGGLRSSGHAAHPQPANQHRVPEVCKVQGT